MHQLLMVFVCPKLKGNFKRKIIITIEFFLILERLRYKHKDMNDLENQLKAADGSNFKLIVTDGVFSMDGNVAPLK